MTQRQLSELVSGFGWDCLSKGERDHEAAEEAIHQMVLRHADFEMAGRILRGADELYAEILRLKRGRS